jgi:hypothetical protein
MNNFKESDKEKGMCKHCHEYQGELLNDHLLACTKNPSNIKKPNMEDEPKEENGACYSEKCKQEKCQNENLGTGPR